MGSIVPCPLTNNEINYTRNGMYGWENQQVHTHIYDHLHGQSSGIEWLKKILKIPVHVQHNLREKMAMILVTVKNNYRMLTW